MVHFFQILIISLIFVGQSKANIWEDAKKTLKKATGTVSKAASSAARKVASDPAISSAARSVAASPAGAAIRNVAENAENIVEQVTENPNAFFTGKSLEDIYNHIRAIAPTAQRGLIIAWTDSGTKKRLRDWMLSERATSYRNELSQELIDHLNSLR